MHFANIFPYSVSRNQYNSVPVVFFFMVKFRKIGHYAIFLKHKLLICSQYGNHCRKDSFGDIPGQVDSLFWGLRILWTIKSVLGLVSGLSLLIVKKFPCGEQMVREANGQNKLRFSQVFWTLILVVTLSHNFSKCRNILQRNLFKEEELFIYCQIFVYIFVPAYSLQFYLEVTVCLVSLSRWRWPTFISAIAAFGIRS